MAADLSMRIQYRHPKLYELLVHKFLYSRRLWERFRSEIGENNTVFDVGAGFGYVTRFLHPSNHYYGIDLNKVFVRHGRNMGINLETKDIFDPKAYKQSDIFLVVDIVHHFSRERLKVLFDCIFDMHKKKLLSLILPL